ncbi:hypothetical protein [Thioclava sp.]|uniref:hypothetical protein n=1 Tax=Thioclava sp. TaxID=1933450 RepID=UPI003241F89E
MQTSKTTFFAAGIAIISIPATIAIAAVRSDEAVTPAPQAESARQVMLDGYEGNGQPMEDIPSEIPYGDLSAFDDVTAIGEAQSPDQPYCDNRAKLVDSLNHDFAEKPAMTKQLGDHRKVELYASSIMGTWTAVYTRADNVSCIVSSGTDWKRGNNPVALLHREGILPAT